MVSPISLFKGLGWADALSGGALSKFAVKQAGKVGSKVVGWVGNKLSNPEWKKKAEELQKGIIENTEKFADNEKVLSKASDAIGKAVTGKDVDWGETARYIHENLTNPNQQTIYINGAMDVGQQGQVGDRRGYEHFVRNLGGSNYRKLRHKAPVMNIKKHNSKYGRKL